MMFCLLLLVLVLTRLIGEGPAFEGLWLAFETISSFGRVRQAWPFF